MNNFVYTLIGITVSLLCQAQAGNINPIDSSIKLLEQEVSSINNEICYKTLVDWDGYRLGSEDEFTEWLAVLYFDKNHRIRKSKFLFFFIEGDGFFYRYYDEKGVAIHSLHATSSGMNNSYSVSRYLNTDNSLLYVDFLRRDDDRGGIIVEHTCRSGGYDLPMPQVGGRIYDEVFNLNSLYEELSRFYGIDSLYMPQNVDSVKFVEAQKGDTTFIVQNSVPLFKNTSGNNLPLMKLHVGNEIFVLDIKNKWYKIKYTKWEGSHKIETVGYINKKNLAPVEMKN